MMKYLIIGLTFFILFGACLTESKDGASLYNNRCGTCHLPPDPACLPKNIWQSQVLPEMGARMGIKTIGYEYRKGEMNMAETSAFYPKEPLISQEDWSKIVAYVMQHAPDSLEVDTARRSRSNPLALFLPEPLKLDERRGSQVTYVNFDDNRRQFMVGQAWGELLALSDGDKNSICEGKSPVMGWSEVNGRSYLTEVGYMPPTERKIGTLSIVENGTAKVILDGLHRPVHTLVSDLNKDGEPEFVISEFGYYTGQLSLSKKGKAGKPETKILSNLPGFIRTVAADMNADGREDLIGVVAQGDEGVFIFFQKENLEFEAQRVIRLSPVYGTSWMEVVDYEGDGDLDVVLAQGDNADFSMVNKPFHGVRIFINDGANVFAEHFFYPIYGATRVLARDFDGDGDVDLAVTAFFPDFVNFPEESFVFLENKNPSAFQFQACTFPEAVSGSWMTADAGDFDGDGDLDILLGSFSHNPAPVPEKIKQDWHQNGPDVLLLRNRLKN